MACAISTGLQTRLEPDLETVLYRVTQETLNDVGEHAGASRVTVSLAADHLSIDSAPGHGTTVDVEMANRPVAPRGT